MVTVLHPPQRAGFRDIQARVRENGQNPVRAEAIAKARKRMAQVFQPPNSLAALRLAKGWSQMELARRIGTSQSRLSRIEAGLDSPLHTTVVKLAEALGVSLDTVSRAILEFLKTRTEAHHG